MIRRVWSLCICFFLVVSSITYLTSIPVEVNADTEVSYEYIDSNVTWTLSDSPYFVTKTLTINSSGNLTIEPGVEIYSSSLVSIRVFGTLIANGEPGNMIRFLPEEADPDPFDNDDTWSGIFIIKLGYGEFSYCEVQGAYWGINLDTFQNTITNCTLINCVRSGIDIGSYVRYLEISSNTFINSGITFGSDSRLSSLSSNIIEDNVVNGKPLLYLIHENNMTVPTQAGAFILINCTDMVLENMDLNATSSGISILLSERINIKDSLLSNVADGIDIIASNNITIENGEVSGCVHGISLSNAFNVTISNCTITDYVIGMDCYRSSECLFIDNDLMSVERGAAGFDLHDCNNNTISRCNIGNINTGINFHSSSYNEIYYCNISNFAGSGIKFHDESEDNLVFHNNIWDFTGDEEPTYGYSESETNRWNRPYPVGGNYWGVYNGVDLYHGNDQDQMGPDGIGDSGFVIKDFIYGHDPYDEYPLMHHYTWWGEVSPDIELISLVNISLINPSEEILFDIWDGDLNLDSVIFSLNDGAYQTFIPPYSINASGWVEGDHIIRIKANDTLGNSRERSFVFHVDLTAPYIVSTIPVDNETFISLNNEISVEFSEPMNTSSVTGSIFIYPQIQNLSYKWSDNGKALAFNYTHILLEDQEYQITINTTARDLIGNRMVQNYAWSFSTLLDTDSDGIPDHQDTDDDNDGYDDVEDAFPLNSTEWLDTDNDSIGNNMDIDDDEDGYNDTIEVSEGTDPLDSGSKPLDNDGDLVPDSIDTDDDNDGVPDENDDFPFDSKRWKEDTQSDLIYYILLIVIVVIIILTFTLLIRKKKKNNDNDLLGKP